MKVIQWRQGHWRKQIIGSVWQFEFRAQPGIVSFSWLCTDKFRIRAHLKHISHSCICPATEAELSWRKTQQFHHRWCKEKMTSVTTIQKTHLLQTKARTFPSSSNKVLVIITSWDQNATALCFGWNIWLQRTYNIQWNEHRHELKLVILPDKRSMIHLYA